MLTLSLLLLLNVCATSRTPQSTDCLDSWEIFRKCWVNLLLTCSMKKSNKHTHAIFTIKQPNCSSFLSARRAELQFGLAAQAAPFRSFTNSITVSTQTKSRRGEGSLRPSLLSLSMPLQRSAGRSAWIVIMAPNRIRERPNDGTWEPGRVELNGCQTLKAHPACEQTHKGWTRPLRGPSYRLSPL